jgi:hypothetical protein
LQSVQIAAEVPESWLWPLTNWNVQDEQRATDGMLGL